MVRFTRPSLLHRTSEREKSENVVLNGIYSLFILRESGCPFFYQIFKKDNVQPDPAILGGFFIALSLFAKEVTDGQIETVTTEPCQYTFHPLQHGLLVICSAKNFNPILIEKVAKRITQLFLTKYKGKLDKPQPAAICAPDLSEQIKQIFGETLIQIH
ncbi:MAG: hypothetical protein ACFFBU_03085 [Promethearchaeota archaeon]